MKLEPLKQWICDTCGQVIESPDDGYLEIACDQNHMISDMCIVHHKLQSPIGSCYQHYSSSLPLSRVTGQDGLACVLSLIDPGEFFNKYQPMVVNVRKVIETIRRLHLPYYEEARLYLDKARLDGYWDGANEFYIYQSEILSTLCQDYR